MINLIEKEGVKEESIIPEIFLSLKYFLVREFFSQETYPIIFNDINNLHHKVFSIKIESLKKNVKNQLNEE